MQKSWEFLPAYATRLCYEILYHRQFIKKSTLLFLLERTVETPCNRLIFVIKLRNCFKTEQFICRRGGTEFRLRDKRNRIWNSSPKNYIRWHGVGTPCPLMPIFHYLCCVLLTNNMWKRKNSIGRTYHTSNSPDKHIL